MKKLNQAIRLAEQGFKVLPLTPLSKIPLKGTSGSKEATSNQTAIEEWWTAIPQANIGIVTDFFLVLDIDVGHGEIDGYKSLETLENTFGKLPETLQTITGNGGTHYYFTKKQGVTLPQKISLVKGIDVKAHENNYVLAPGSEIKKEDGSIGSYTTKKRVKMAECPQWLIDFILRDEPKEKPLYTYSSNSNRYRNKTTELLERLVLGAEKGARNDTVARVTGQLLAYGVKMHLAWELIQTMNNNTLEPLDQKELETTFLSICKKELRAI